MLVDDGADFESPSVGGKSGALVAGFQREADPNGPFPFFGNAHTRADVIADPLVALAVRSDTGKDVKAGFEPIVPALGDFDGLVFLVVGGVGAVGSEFASFGGEVAVEFDHCVTGRHRVGAVDLDFVIALCERRNAK